MEFNKCSRCGSFFISYDDVCPKCKVRDKLEFGTFKNFVEENGLTNNLDTLSNATGISKKNLSRYMDYAGLKFSSNCDESPKITL